MMSNDSLRLAALTLTAFLCACSEMPLDQKAVVPAAQYSSTSSALHSNSIKYREQSAPHRGVRSGIAVVTARALMGSDGNTTIEATTGDLDGSGAVGTIEKVQLKVFDPRDATRLAFTSNYNGLSGALWRTTSAVLARNQHVQVQATVRGADGKRTDVVTVDEQVHLRPDLSVTDLQAQPSYNTPTPIVAVLAEQNGQEGARANCVLYVNGVVADRANNVWVANGDHVSCVFLHSFGEGDFNITVRAESVLPGDWSMANNQKSLNVTVAPPIRNFNYNVFAQEDVLSSRSDAWTTFTGNPRVYSYYYHDEQVRTADSHFNNFIFKTTQAWDSPLDFMIRLYSDGVLLHNLSWTGVTPTCGMTYGYGVILYTCPNPATGLLELSLYINTSRAHYISHSMFANNVCTTADPASCNNLSADDWEEGLSAPDQGPYQPWGAALRWDVTANTSNSGLYHISATRSLPAWVSNGHSESSVCSSQDPLNQSCWQTVLDSKTRSGWIW